MLHLVSGRLVSPRTLQLLVFEPLLFVDIEETPRSGAKSEGFIPNGRAAQLYVYKREGADVLLEWLVQRRVPFGFWTHERARRVRAALKLAFPLAWRSRRMFRSQRSCSVHEGVYVKDPRALRTRFTLLIDFVSAQATFQLEHRLAHPLLLTADGDLSAIVRWLRKRWQSRIVLV